nr:SLBB domain-containing protein [Marinobacter goseongensis]
MFAGEPESFISSGDVAVPVGYRVGPGDEIRVLLTGQENQDLSLIVSRSGTIEIPQIGPVNVHGKSLEELRNYLQDFVRERFIGVKSFVSLGELRSISVFLTGESRNPGVYSVSAFSNLSHALSVSGGVKISGSLRNIQLIRNGETISQFDLYDLMLAGDRRADLQLKSGDVIFIPTAKQRVAVSGAVVRPAVYELRPNNTLEDAIKFAGGLRSKADPSKIQVSRLKPDSNRTLLDFDFNNSKNVRLTNGDSLRVGEIYDRLRGVIEILGDAPIAGEYQWEQGMRLSAFLNNRDDHLAEEADLEFAIIVSRTGENFDASLRRFTPRDVLAQPGSEADPILKERDSILLFNRNTERTNLLEPVLEELQQNLLPGQQAPVVSVTGAVRHPGSYPLLPGTSVKDLLTYAGGLTNASYQSEAELIRQRLTATRSESQLVKLELKNPADQNLELLAADRIHIKQIPDLNLQQTVVLEGEVTFPGTYTLRRGETLSQVIERAGGLSEFAYAKGAVFTRESLREQEQRRLDEAQRRLRRDLAISGPQSPGEVDTVEGDDETVVRVLDEVANAQAVGRLVIDLPALLKGDNSRDVRLQDGDTLVIPEISQSVSVMGEVQFATSHLHDGNLSAQDYINRSGGLAYQADEQRIYVIKADGSVTVPNQSRWFGSSNPLEPGDTIVVPLNLSQLSSLELAKDVSQIIYQVALGASAVRSFQN